ncbi:zinc knuckle CX2CX4HX4C containing protein [Tanacetum coccineum]
MVGKDGKPLMAARRVPFDANRPGVNEHGDLISKDGNTRKVVRQVNFENNATAAVVNNIAATSQNDALNKNENVIHVFGHNECTYGVLLTDEHDTPANDVVAANTNKEDTRRDANHATMEPGVLRNSFNVDANNNNNMHDKSPCVQNDIHGTKEGTHATDAVGTGANVAIPLAGVEEVSQRFENTLYGYFIGKRLVFPLVETYVKNAWAKFGLERTMLTNGFFFFQFATREGMERVLKNGS